jgi:membrane protease YdiL (CAAX protease family)
MRLVGYYAFHTFVNQLKKLFKTWVMVFLLICGLLGGMIGYGVAVLTDTEEEPQEEIIVETAEEPETGVSSDTLELVFGGVVLGLLVFFALRADQSAGSVFQPADVNLLFASPMKPQSVLMFRLAAQIGAIAVLALLYSPTLALELSLGPGAAIALVVAAVFTLLFGQLLSVLLYTLSSTHPKLKARLRSIVLGLLLLLAAGYFLCWKHRGGTAYQGAVAFFNGRLTRLIPVWGWCKGILLYAVEGRLVPVLLCGLGCLVLTILLALMIWRLPADFYEDAMAKSEETARMRQEAQEGKSVIVTRKKKDRPDRIRRDGMGHGSGASVFLHKSLYNRFRFAKLGIFTKTLDTYLVAGVGAALISLLVLEMDSFTVVGLVLGGLVFFRSLGNPLAQDTKLDLFRLIPEPGWKKLLYSLLGGTINCALDLLPGMVLAMLLLRTAPLVALGWLLLIVTLDFYATCVGTFIGLSVPVNAGNTIKQIIQVMFLYFGLLPDGGLLALGLLVEDGTYFPLTALLAALINLALGALFLGLTPRFLEPRSKPYEPRVPLEPQQLRKARKAFSRAGLSVFVVMAVSSVLQLVLYFALDALCPAVLETSWAVWVYTFAPLYLVAVPLGLLTMHSVPKSPPESHSMSLGQWLKAFVICIFLMYAGNLIGTLVTALIQLGIGTEAVNPIVSYVTEDSLVLKVLVMVILAPIIEEYLCRKQIIDRLRPYGEKLAVLISALIFSLFHGNLSQMFYAFALGLAFGYIYLKTGKLRYSTALHMCINFLGSVVSTFVMDSVDVDAVNQALAGEQVLSQISLYSGYVALMLILAAIGLVLLLKNKKLISFTQAELELPRGQRFQISYLNAGMLLLTLICLISVIMTFLS